MNTLLIAYGTLYRALNAENLKFFCKWKLHVQRKVNHKLTIVFELFLSLFFGQYC